MPLAFSKGVLIYLWNLKNKIKVNIVVKNKSIYTTSQQFWVGRNFKFKIKNYIYFKNAGWIKTGL